MTTRAHVDSSGRSNDATADAAPRADLVARDFLVTRHGGTVTVKGVIANGGDAPVSGPFTIVLGVQHATQYKEHAVNVPASTTILPGATFTTPTGLGNIPTGRARFFMLVDASANVTETLESNNDLQLDWAPPVALSSVPGGRTIPGAPVTAVVRKRGLVSLFLADPAGGVYAAEGSPGGWGTWASVSEGRTIPGGAVTAVVREPGLVSLFLADPAGGVYATEGNDASGWGPWRSVSEGRTIPGGAVTAVVRKPGLVSLFLADPAGGVYATEGSPADGWGPWRSVSEGRTTSGAPVTAVVRKPGLVSLFLADPAGGVYATEGSPADGWGPWRSVSEGRTIPGGSGDRGRAGVRRRRRVPDRPRWRRLRDRGQPRWRLATMAAGGEPDHARRLTGHARGPDA